MRAPNVANLLFLIGLIALGLTFCVPAWSARRVARVESRADQVARTLRDLAALEPELDLTKPGLAALLVDSLRAACKAEGQPDSDLPSVVAEPIENATGPMFQNRHYLFLLTREPLERNGDPSVVRPIEVYAWPRTLLPPGRSAFFMPEVGDDAYTRNLAVEYAGLTKIPKPGEGRPHPDGRRKDGHSYRGYDDERWLLVPGR